MDSHLSYGFWHCYNTLWRIGLRWCVKVITANYMYMQSSFFFWSGNDMGVLKQMWSGQLVWVHCSITWVLHYFILSKISALFTSHCLVSNWGGLGTSPSILGLLTKDQQSQNENKEFYMCIIILISFGVNWANIEQHIHVAIKTLKIY